MLPYPGMYVVRLIAVCIPRTPIPVVVSELERDNEDEGQPDRSLQKNSAYHM